MNKERLIHAIIVCGFLAILTLPLLNIPPWFSPPDWGKTIVFRIILSVLLFLFLIKLLWKQKVQSVPELFQTVSQTLKQNFALSLLLLLFFVYLLSTIFSLDRYFSFWGTPQRAWGFLNFSFYILFALLLFVCIPKNIWNKLLGFAVLIGVFVSFVAIIQRFGLFSEEFVSVTYRPVGTLGNTITLGAYLLMLSFLSLILAVGEHHKIRKYLYIASFALFGFVIFLTLTRSAFLGMGIGLLYFFFFKPKKSLMLKRTMIILLFCGIGIVLYANTQSRAPNFIQQNPLLAFFLERLSIEKALGGDRPFGWQIEWKGIMERPLLGYGPYNSYIGFNKHYDPLYKTLYPSTTGWWDTAHNVFLDIAASVGFVGLAVYLLFIGILLWQLKKVKQKIPEYALPAHGLQAAFVGYLTANFFFTDFFPTYLIFFLLVAYALHLISFAPQAEDPNQTTENRKPRNYVSGIPAWKYFMMLVSGILLAWFVWQYNFKPLAANKEINWAEYYAQKNQCEKALERMEHVLSLSSFLDYYVHSQYVDMIGSCIKKLPTRTQELSQRAVQLLKEQVKVRPYEPRTWILLGGHTNNLISHSADSNLREELQKDAELAFEKAYQLSPRRPETFMEWVRTYVLSQEYEKIKEKAGQCLALDPRVAFCWWQQGLARIALGEIEEAQKDFTFAEEKGYPVDSKVSLLKVLEDYTAVPESLRNLMYYQNLTEIALKLVEFYPEKKAEVETFLKTLPK